MQHFPHLMRGEQIQWPLYRLKKSGKPLDTQASNTVIHPHHLQVVLPTSEDGDLSSNDGIAVALAPPKFILGASKK